MTCSLQCKEYWRDALGVVPIFLRRVFSVSFLISHLEAHSAQEPQAKMTFPTQYSVFRREVAEDGKGVLRGCTTHGTICKPNQFPRQVDNPELFDWIITE